ncbi:hypothetical protein [Peredibacter starrii]|uniref:Uncharacterized protein n=1 Tax=Peredibacter starrii TaxID=28202 RepID=A0AAX4HM18_9BACT|nr:hypothetical protein [Peredibacter starrii]WPU64220.1 hypothetical protein SOO65_16120 [Peredibacter starrii]
MKTLILILVALFSFSAFSQDCATNLAQLKSLVANNGFPTKWAEKGDQNPFLLHISERNNLLNLRLTTKDGEWAMMDTRVCKKNSERYAAEVKKIVWGPAAPEIAKGRNVKEVGIRLPYHSTLEVSISIFWSGEFEPVR